MLTEARDKDELKEPSELGSREVATRFDRHLYLNDSVLFRFSRNIKARLCYRDVISVCKHFIEACFAFKLKIANKNSNKTVQHIGNK